MSDFELVKIGTGRFDPFTESANRYSPSRFSLLICSIQHLPDEKKLPSPPETCLLEKPPSRFVLLMHDAPDFTATFLCGKFQPCFNELPADAAAVKFFRNRHIHDVSHARRPLHQEDEKTGKTALYFCHEEKHIGRDCHDFQTLPAEKGVGFAFKICDFFSGSGEGEHGVEVLSLTRQDFNFHDIES